MKEITPSKDILFTRTCCRTFDPEKPVSEAQITFLIEAAETAPTAKNRQPYMIFAITNNEMKREIAEAANIGRQRQFAHMSNDVFAKTAKGLTGSNDECIAEAPLVMLIFRNSDPTYQEAAQESERLMIKEEEGVANAAYSILLGAESIGLSSGWICSPLYIQAELKTIFQKYGIDWNDNWKPRAALPIGYPKHPLVKPKRPKSFDDIAKIIT